MRHKKLIELYAKLRAQDVKREKTDQMLIAEILQADARYVLVGIKRRWVPEWLFKLLAPLAGSFLLRQLLTRRLSEFEDRRFNGCEPRSQR